MVRYNLFLCGHLEMNSDLLLRRGYLSGFDDVKFLSKAEVACSSIAAVGGGSAEN